MPWTVWVTSPATSVATPTIACIDCITAGDMLTNESAIDLLFSVLSLVENLFTVAYADAGRRAARTG